MATLVRSSPRDDSVWGRFKHSADLACWRSSAYLSGQYSFSFHNETPWTVKMHLLEDFEGAGAKQQEGIAQAQRGYFLTLPAQTSGIEIPMTSPLVIVTAGFFRPERSAYEVFWECRRFSWEPGLSVSVRSRHSVDANKFRTDVYAGAPEADSWVPNPAYARPAPATRPLTLLPPACAVGESKCVTMGYSRVDKTWRAGDVACVLPDGSLKLQDHTCAWVVRPEQQATIMPVNWSIFDFERSRGGDLQLRPSAASRQPTASGETLPPAPEAEETLGLPLLIAAPPDTLPYSYEKGTGPCGSTCAPTTALGCSSSTGTLGNSFSLGQSVQVFCQNKGTWLSAQVVGTLPDGSVTVQWGASKSRRTLPPEDLAWNLKTI